MRSTAVVGVLLIVFGLVLLYLLGGLVLHLIILLLGFIVVVFAVLLILGGLVMVFWRSRGW